jgi:hypothetical protein
LRSLGRATPVRGDMVAIGGCSVLVHVHEQSHRSPLGTQRQPENRGKKKWLEMSARRDAARKRVLRQLDVPMPLSAAD